jgi:hypothetical protein
MRDAMSYGESRLRGTQTATACGGRGGCGMYKIGYWGNGVEIEDDIDRLRQRKVEFEADTRRTGRLGQRPRRLRDLRLAGPAAPVLPGSHPGGAPLAKDHARAR